MATQATPKQEAETVMQPYEAGFSTNFFLTHPVMGRQQFTFRGAFATDWTYVMVEAGEFVKHMREKGWQTEGDMTHPAPAQPSRPQNSAGSAPAAPTRATATPTATQSGLQTLDIIKLEIEPQADGKAKLKFYSAGHKYPDLYSTLPIGNCVALLADVGEWTQEYFEKAGIYDVEFVAEWKNSDKLNSKGNPYKDIVRLVAPQF